MDLQPYVENIQIHVVVAAEAGGEEARELAERLLSPLDAAIRLTLQDALVGRGGGDHPRARPGLGRAAAART